MLVACLTFAGSESASLRTGGRVGPRSNFVLSGRAVMLMATEAVLPRIAWNRRYGLTSHIQSSLWIVPVFALLAQVALKRLAERLGTWMVGQGYYDLKTGFFGIDAAGAQNLLERIFTVNLSCLVFTFGSLLVAIQVAGGQYTPRIIATTLLRDNVIRWIVGWFVFTMLWSHRTMVQLGQIESVPQFQVFLASLFGLASIIAFIILIDYSAKLLRPVSLVRRIAEQGARVIESVYPYPTSNVASPPTPERKRGWLSSWLRSLPRRTLHLPQRSKSPIACSITGASRRSFWRSTCRGW